jgi:hypothetical protein
MPVRPAFRRAAGRRPGPRSDLIPVRELTIPGTWGILARRQQDTFGSAVPHVTRSARCRSNQS